MSTRVRFFAKIMDAKSALNAVSEELNHADLCCIWSRNYRRFSSS
jgi:hypothetical protein